MALLCPRCQAPAAPHDAGAARAPCGVCGHAFEAAPPANDLAPAPPSPPGEPDAPFRAARPRPPLPASLRVIEREPAARAAHARGYREAQAGVAPGELEIRRPARTFGSFVALFALLFVGNCAHDAFGLSSVSLPLLPKWLLFLAFFAAPAYACLVRCCNARVIRATPDEVSTHYGPLPWPGQKLAVPARDVDHVYYEANVSRNAEGATFESFHVRAAMRDGRKVTLLSDLPDREQADFIKWRLEEFLDIPVAPLAGPSQGRA